MQKSNSEIEKWKILYLNHMFIEEVDPNIQSVIFSRGKNISFGQYRRELVVLYKSW